MAFYNTQTLPIFKVQDPLLSLTKNVLALQSGIVQPIKSLIESDSPVTYTAQQVLNGSIIRSGTTNGVTDTWPSAEEIVLEIEKRLKAIKGQSVSVRVGDNVPLIIINKTNDGLDFTGGVNVENDFNSISSNQARLGQIIVIGLNPAKLYVDGL